MAKCKNCKCNDTVKHKKAYVEEKEEKKEEEKNI
jgi:hypothetical protein